MSGGVFTLENERLRLRVNALGAEMQSLQLAGKEYLWQGDARYWGGRAPHLFPYIARLTGGRYTYCGQSYGMDIHGFLKDSVLKPLRQARESLVLELCSSEATRSQYPFNFCLRIAYHLEGARLRVCYRITNTGAESMYFGLGGHPGFQVPLEPGLKFSDYELVFSRCCQPRRVLFSPDKFVVGQAAFALKNGRCLPLRHSLFNDDAIVLEGTPGEVILATPKGSAGVKVQYAGFRYLGLWHTPGTRASFLCIEPWSSLPSRQGITEELTTQKDLLRLEKGEEYRNEWSAELYG